MADWTNLPNLAVGVGGLPSGTTVTALRDNPIAIAEGADGAPKVQGIALDKVFLCQITRGNNVTPIGVNDLDNVKGILFIGALHSRSPASATQIRFSTNNGDTWGDWSFWTFAEPTAFATIHLDLITGDWVSTGVRLEGQIDNFSSGALTQSGSFGVLANVNAFQIRNTFENARDWFNFNVFAIGGAV